MASGLVDLPDELVSHVLLKASTPTFVHLTLTSKKFFNIARQDRKVLLHHLHQVPGDKSKFSHDQIDNEKLFLLLRQRATNCLAGINFTANMHEHLARDVPIDPNASSVGGLDADYVRMALSFKDSADIRQYTSHCAIKEKIKHISGPGVRVLKLVQWGRFVSALCLTPSRQIDDFSDASDTDSEDSETEILVKKPFSPTVNAHIQRSLRKSRTGRLIKILKVDHRYQVIHFDVYTMEDSQIFEIIPPPDVVPRDFAVQSSSLCAILWDKTTPGRRPTEDAYVITYAIDTRMEEPVYEQKTVWPKTGKPSRNDGESDDEDSPEDFPERIAFFKDGRRIKMYDAGGIVPYQIFSTSSTQFDQYASTNVISFDGFSVHVDTPFFGTHTTQLDELNQQSYCFQHHLCLGVASLNIGPDSSDDEVKVLCILRSQNRNYPENCEHRVSLSRMTHVSANNSTVVARLWGWEELHTNSSGKEMVAVSPGGTRIAIAMWNKVLVYPLNPKILCDEVVVDSSEDEAPKTKKKRKKPRKSWETACTDYYQRKKDKNFLGWRIAELRPIVLDLEGAIAHKMSWSPAKGPVTDTEEPSATVIQNADAIDNDGPKEEEESIQPHSGDGEVLITGPEEGSNLEAGAQASTSIPQSLSQTTTAETNEQENTAMVGDAQSGHVIEVYASVAPVLSDVITSLPTGQDPPPAAIESTTNTSSGQISPPEPSSPLQATKKSELSQPSALHLGGVSSSLPKLLSGSLTSFPSSPFSPYGTTNHSQASKTSTPSTRKKEKSPEVVNADANSLPALEKKFQTSLSLAAGDSFVTQEQQPSWLSPSKAGPKPSQTVAEALAVTPASTLTSSIEAVPNIATIPPTLSTMFDESQTSAPSHTNQVQINDEEQEDYATTNHSKNPSTAAAPHTQISDDRDIKDEVDSKSARHRKRVTEDELIILTDRGIQVWNLGARAKGKRKRSYLKLEESLKGKLPRMNGKRKETAVRVAQEH